MKNLVYILFFSFFVINTVDAQSSKKIWRLANEAFEKSDFYEAIDLFLEYEKEKELDNETKLKIGISHFFTNSVELAIPYLIEVSEDKNDYKETALFYLGRSYHANLEFAKSIKYYKEYLKIDNGNEVLKRSVYNEIMRCRAGMKLKHLPKNAYVENLGGLVNGIRDDIAPLFSVNRKGRIYFSSQRRGSTGGLRDDEGLINVENGQNDFDVYFSDVINGHWSIAKRMPNFVNTVRNDVLMDFSSNGRVMYIFRSLNNYSGIIALDTFKVDRKTNLNYYYLDSPVKPENGDKTVFYCNDSTLLFSSNRPGGYGGRDLYLAINKNGRWTEALNLGPAINTIFDETSPYLANDGVTLFYSSNNLNSIGGLDVFYNKYDPITKLFSPAKNIGLPINSAGDDSGFKFDISGQQVIFSSSRKQGYGERDIYLAYMNSKMIHAPFRLYPVIADLLENENVSKQAIDETSEKIVVNINPLYYTSEKVLTRKNIKELDRLIENLNSYPYIDISLEVYTDDVDSPNKFNLFFSIKKGEEVKQYLIQNGIDSKRITIKGMGKNYPVALSTVNNNSYAFGKKMNQRVDVVLNTYNDKHVKINYSKPTIPENIKIESQQILKNSLGGLSFRIEIANNAKMFQGDDLEGYDAPYVELLPDEFSSRYYVGLSKRFSPIKILYKGILKNNPTANIVPFWNGERATISKIKGRVGMNKEAESYLDFLQQGK